jgi:hypothetical protein
VQIEADAALETKEDCGGSTAASTGDVGPLGKICRICQEGPNELHVFTYWLCRKVLSWTRSILLFVILFMPFRQPDPDDRVVVDVLTSVVGGRG